MSLTAKQHEAEWLLGEPASHTLLRGGSRSGKTYLLIRSIVARAIKAPRSRHVVLRFRFNHVKTAIIHDTFPAVMRGEFPSIPYEMNKTDWFATLPNHSEIWFGGLDDKERTEKILGNEYATVFLNECSQISWQARNIVLTRLAQKAPTLIGKAIGPPLRPRMYYDCNPPSKAHWTYKVFIQHVDPETGLTLANPSDYATMQLNPQDNVEHISADYLATLESLPARLRKRFLAGEFADANPNTLIPEETIDTWRHTGGALPDFVRVIVGVDPSGSGDEDNADNDAIGIVVAGLGTDGNAYVLEDCTVKAGPATWGRVATAAFDRHMASLVVGEVNYGGAMVKHVIQTARPRTPYLAVTASRGKHVRCEPVAALYEQGKLRHVGTFRELEDELAGFSTIGYTGDRSPNRADALIWAITALFPAMVAGRDTVPVVVPLPTVTRWGGARG